MLSNIGGNDSNNTSSGALVVGNGKCSADAEVSVVFSALAEAPANCAHIHESAAAAKVAMKDDLTSQPAAAVEDATLGCDYFRK